MENLNIYTDDLHTVTHELLLNDERTLFVIASESGVGFHWLGKFKQNKYEDPGVSKVQKLYRYLSKSI